MQTDETVVECGLILKVTMRRHTSFPVLLLCVLLCFNPSLSYSLKNCTIGYSENVTYVSVYCNNRELTAVPDDIPKNVIYLNLANNEISILNRTDLSGLTKLDYLEMQFNSITYIYDEAFADLLELEYLDISYNRLTYLGDNTFVGLSKLKHLSLENNQISSISPLAFQPLISLTGVGLRANLLHVISDIVPILQLPNIQVLLAGENRFTSFESDDLPINKSNLRALVLDKNPLRKFSLRRDIFPHLKSLELGDPSPNFEWDVPDKTFLRSITSFDFTGTVISFETYRGMIQNAKTVDYIILSYMKKWLDKGLIDVACQMPALTDLHLTFNDLYILNDTLLRHCTKLINLRLESNDITEISESSFRSLNRLKWLDIHNNHLPRVPVAIRRLSTLEHLNLDTNDIAELGCSDFLNLTRLTRLNLEKNRISKLRKCVFKDLIHLKSLTMDGNPIFNLNDAFTTSLQNLQDLRINGNNIKIIHKGEFGSLSSLQSLELEAKYNEFQLERGALEGLDHLQYLTLSLTCPTKELFKGLPHLESLNIYLLVGDERPLTNSSCPPPLDEDPFLYLPSLKHLTLTNIRTAYIIISPKLLTGLKHLEIFKSKKLFTKTPHPDTFTHTPLLTSLEIISSNVFDPNPALFWPIPNLESLDLSDSKLKSLEFLSQAGLSALRRLTLRQNEITVISETVFQSLPALTHLDLAENPFTCDCSNAGFIQWVKSNNQTQVVNAYQYACSFPAAQQGSMLLDFDIQSCWMDVSFLCFISSSGVVVLTLLASFIYHFLRWQLAYAYHLFLAFLYDSRKRKKGAALHYDAFISYNVHDEAWVLREMLPVLEGEQGWRLCLHHRDFQPGKPIIENITDAIYGSRKTICVISRRYLQSEWCSREIQMASFRLFDEQKDVLILLFLEEIPAYQMSPYYRMRKLVKRRTYLSWPQAGPHTGLFWQKVQRALETGEAPTDNTDPLTGQAGC